MWQTEFPDLYFFNSLSGFQDQVPGELPGSLLQVRSPFVQVPERCNEQTFVKFCISF
jgi:hypothetical protein